MGKAIEAILEHPISTVIVVVALSNGISNVIDSFKGNGNVKPFISITNSKAE